MIVQNLSSQKPFTTKDGSQIRSILDRTNAPVENQSLAEASIPAGGATARHFHKLSEELYFLLEGEGLMEIEMKIRGLMMDPVTQLPIVILKDVDSETLLPIWVGVFEANAIALEIEKVATPRPMTHDLIRNVLSGLDTFVHRVVVTELRADTFYAVIWLERDGKIISVDSRPSDALALALRADCPIYVDEEVIRTSKSTNAESERLSNDELKKFLEGLNDEDLGKYKM